MDLFRKLVNRFYLKLNRSGKHWVLRFIDTIIFMASIYAAFALRFDLTEALVQVQKFYLLIIMIFPLKHFCFWFVGIYKPVLRYTGVEFLWTASIAVIGSTGVILLAGFILVLPLFPRSVLILDTLLTLMFTIGVRIVIRWFVYTIVTGEDKQNSQEKVIVYGAGEAGSQLVQALSRVGNHKVIGFVDDNPQLQNQVISGITVFSPNKLQNLVAKHEVHSILLAMPSIGKQKNRELVEKIKHFGVQIKTIPGIGEIVSGKVSINEIRDIDITDLLGREEVKPDPELLKKNISDKAVLVTGAGGSIGSELCRQIIQQQPKRLVLYDINEYFLYKIDLELRDGFSDLEIIPYLGSVINKKRLEKIISDHSIQTIYHAAAYKHVPLIESNLEEGIVNNIKGTLTVVEAAENQKVETFVLISTDKAVRPTNVMGATKRVSELIVQAYAEKSGNLPRFSIVRFGNVLDSTGSVVPRFREQLAMGHNLTLTHEKITRYFMSIPEAARLVIQAGALGEEGDVYLLDMGDPVRIYDLAVNMIELSGLKLGSDVNIDITGLRPGEKLYEELLIDKDNYFTTSHPRIFKAKEKFLLWCDLQDKIEMLLSAVNGSESKQNIISALRSLVPEFCTI